VEIVCSWLSSPCMPTLPSPALSDNKFSQPLGGFKIVLFLGFCSYSSSFFLMEHENYSETVCILQSSLQGSARSR